jgi:hypothetical protein
MTQPAVATCDKDRKHNAASARGRMFIWVSPFDLD